MSAFDWLQLENISNDIELLRDQLTDARSHKAIARAKVLEEEIARSEERRGKLLFHLTISMVSDAETRAHNSSRRSVRPDLKPTGDEHRAVAQPGNDAEHPKPAADDTWATQTAPTTATDDPGEESIPAPEQLAPDEGNSPQLATLASLTKDLDVARVRLAVAKLRKDPDLARHLEEKIAIGKAHRESLAATAALETAAGAQTEHHRDTIKHFVREDDAGLITELPPQSDHSSGDAGPGAPSCEVTGPSGPEDAGSQLEDPKAADDCDRVLDSVQEPSADKVECEPASSTAEDQTVTSDADPPLPNNVPIEKPFQAKVGDERHVTEPEEHIAASDTSSSKIDEKVDDTEGETNMWDQMEFERTKKEIELRRDEMLERHSNELKEMLAKQAKELRRLEDDRDELEALEKAIGDALRKFKAPSADTAVTRLDEERASRQQGLS